MPQASSLLPARKKAIVLFNAYRAWKSGRWPLRDHPGYCPRPVLYQVDLATVQVVVGGADGECQRDGQHLRSLGVLLDVHVAEVRVS